MNLIIDIGNSRIKAAVFNGGEIVERLIIGDSAVVELDALLAKYPAIDSAILSSTRDGKHPAEDFLAEHMHRFVRFDSNTPTPLKNLYLTPETLGPDRLAAAVGANALYPHKNLLVIDFGTALTIDMVTAAGEYLGGNISPGASMRFRALSDYTGRLPLIEMPDIEVQNGTEETVLGRSTAEAIEAGVVNGIVFELEGYISRMSDKFGELIPIFTGGEAKFFENKLKSPIFAEYRTRFGNLTKTSFHRLPSPFTIFANYDLVFIGLNTILNRLSEYNEVKK